MGRLYNYTMTGMITSSTSPPFRPHLDTELYYHSNYTVVGTGDVIAFTQTTPTYMYMYKYMCMTKLADTAKTETHSYCI